MGKKQQTPCSSCSQNFVQAEHGLSWQKLAAPAMTAAEIGHGLSPGICHDLYPDAVTLHIVEDKLGAACSLVVHSASYLNHCILIMLAVWKILVLCKKVRQADGNMELVGIQVGA